LFALAKEEMMDDRQGRFAWYELLTTDMAAARDFYASVVGWTARDAGTPRFAYSIFATGGTPVAGLMELLPEEAGATPRWVGYVAVDDLDATVDRFKRLGGAVKVPPTETNIGRISILIDPQKATLAVAEGLKLDRETAELDQPGRVGWHELLASDARAAFAFYSEVFGWQRAQSQANPMESYQLLAAGGRMIGGIFTKLPIVPFPFWLYYFDVADIASAARRVTAGGGRIRLGPIELPGVGWMAWCIDPQGAVFALQATANQGGVERLSDAELGWSAAWGGFASRGKLVAGPAAKAVPKPARKR
jgi:predicted enzyme related to lactoylglutathione lyase